MKRRVFGVSVVAVSLHPSSYSPAEAVGPLVLSLAEALLVIGRSLMSFFIKEALPTVAKNTFRKSLTVSAVSGYAVAEGLAQFKRFSEQRVISTKLGYKTDVELLINNPLDKEIHTRDSTLVLFDEHTGRYDVSEPFHALLLVERRTSSTMMVTIHRLPKAGMKRLALFSQGQMIGQSALIVVT